MANDCPNCGEEYTKLGLHFKSCGYPEPSEYQKDLLIGCLMGDGNINQSGGTYPQMSVENTNKKYLNWLDDELGWLSSGIRHKHDLGDRPCYSLTVMRHPFLNQLADWYNSGKKRFPDEIEVNRTIAKMWYVGDGGLRWKKDKYSYASIRSMNENDRTEFMNQLFDFNTTFADSYINFYADTDAFLEWLGEPVPGFEYKWESDSRENYKYLKQQGYIVDE